MDAPRGVEAEPEALGTALEDVRERGGVAEPVVAAVVVDGGRDLILLGELFDARDGGFPVLHLERDGDELRARLLGEIEEAAVPRFVRLDQRRADPGDGDALGAVGGDDARPRGGIVVIDVRAGEVHDGAGAVADGVRAFAVVLDLAERVRFDADLCFQVEHGMAPFG